MAKVEIIKRGNIKIIISTQEEFYKISPDSSVSVEYHNVSKSINAMYEF